jgi:hypothetical protein
MRRLYKTEWRQLMYDQGVRDRRAARPRRDLALMSPGYAAPYLRGYLGGPRGPFPRGLREIWLRRGVGCSDVPEVF